MEKHLEERALLVGVNLNSKKDFDIESSMEELKELVKAAEGTPVSTVIQNKHRIDATFYSGKGKLSEIANYCDELDIDTVVFNDELSGAQLRNIEEVLERKVIDRTTLILDIFSRRATTKEGKLQVELAQLKYRLPRLTGLGTQLSRLGGGIGTRGPGEKKLETDRRHIESRVDEIRKQLKEVENVREVKRKNRLSSDIPIIALVGYTNAGKSTLFNELIKFSSEYSEEKDVYTEDMLFATLDTTLRKTNLPNGQKALVIDTVGFVSKLPTHLVAAFKGTLEEVNYADVLLHVVDVTNDDFDIQVKTTLDILKQLKATEKPIIAVFNKIDKKNSEDINYSIEGPKVYISAKEKINIDKLWNEIELALNDKFYRSNLLIPYADTDIASYIFNNYNVQKFEHKDNGTFIDVTLNNKDYNKYKKYIID
ncbi:GTPase HflX [Clostridium sp. D2Q-11]|uniref:GTPase HflX n=1 Tax=Anaeromonas frigoriresistens TaxID=2683708 RepID=A0A942UZF1_9FIRM|nr:GTPase HflX [Anaeromonas frigoriresistens]MBS4539629.1 GTPase HflX [Anaeromonas frigoriresistens]